MASSSNLESKSYAILHILVIGAAGDSDDSSRGQLPSVENILEFQLRHPGRKCYFYFIDPVHIQCRSDMELFAQYHARGIAHCVVTLAFSFDTFRHRYRVGVDEEALFIDYANVASSEHDFVSRLGANANWHYLVPGCSGPRLNLENAYTRASRLPKYTIQSTAPIPAGLSPEYIRGIRQELDNILAYVRLLPAGEEHKSPPEWLVAQLGANRDVWHAAREQAYQALTAFFRINNIPDPDCTPVEKWYSLVNKIFKSAS